MIWTCSRAYPY